ncbi:hypothetical protein RZN22_17715, partial [Bacillaceae bacterium S4-13-58]
DNQLMIILLLDFLKGCMPCESNGASRMGVPFCWKAFCSIIHHKKEGLSKIAILQNVTQL